MPRLLIHFARYGPYHHARLRAAHEALSPLGWEVIGLEIAGTDATYAWDEAKGAADGPRVVTAFPGRVYEEIKASEYRRVLLPLLDVLAPDAMAIAGWGSTDALTCLSWCRKNDVRRIVMSETRAADGKRVWWKELAKRYLISRFDGALVGGKSHRDYLVSLGMKPERIAFGYNVVDDEFFREECLKVRDQETGVRSQGSEDGDSPTPFHQQPTSIQSNSSPLLTDHCSLGTTPYFLASNRFIDRKNLARLIEAYAIYGRDRFTHRSEESACGGPAAPDQVGRLRKDDPTHPPWHLCLLGDGELKPDLIAQCHELGLSVIESAPWEQQSLITNNLYPITHPNHGVVWMPGFRQIDELPRFYAHAGCFIHPALEEPWGLVINEAMASGLPILSSNNVGAAEELVDNGVNGWKFDPSDVEEIARHMSSVSALNFPLSTFSSASLRILEERCPTRAFGEGLSQLVSSSPASSHVPSAGAAKHSRILLKLLAIILAMAVSCAAWIQWGDWPKTQVTGDIQDPALLVVLGGGGDKRARVASRLAGEFPNVPLLVTGDDGAIKETLLADGIPESRILIEAEATSTWENGLFSKPWVDAAGEGELVIVTDDLHGPRAMGVFSKLFPDRRLVLACSITPRPLKPWQQGFRRRERAAAIYYLIRYGVWSW